MWKRFRTTQDTIPTSASCLYCFSLTTPVQPIIPRYTHERAVVFQANLFFCSTSHPYSNTTLTLPPIRESFTLFPFHLPHPPPPPHMIDTNTKIGLLAATWCFALGSPLLLAWGLANATAEASGAAPPPPPSPSPPHLPSVLKHNAILSLFFLLLAVARTVFCISPLFGYPYSFKPHYRLTTLVHIIGLVVVLTVLSIPFNDSFWMKCALSVEGVLCALPCIVSLPSQRSIVYDMVAMGSLIGVVGFDDILLHTVLSVVVVASAAGRGDLHRVESALCGMCCVEVLYGVLMGPFSCRVLPVVVGVNVVAFVKEQRKAAVTIVHTGLSPEELPELALQGFEVASNPPSIDDVDSVVDVPASNVSSEVFIQPHDRHGFSLEVLLTETTTHDLKRIISRQNPHFGSSTLTLTLQGNTLRERHSLFQDGVREGDRILLTSRPRYSVRCAKVRLAGKMKGGGYSGVIHDAIGRKDVSGVRDALILMNDVDNTEHTSLWTNLHSAPCVAKEVLLYAEPPLLFSVISSLAGTHAGQNILCKSRRVFYRTGTTYPPPLEVVALRAQLHPQDLLLEAYLAEMTTREVIEGLNRRGSVSEASETLSLLCSKGLVLSPELKAAVVEDGAKRGSERHLATCALIAQGCRVSEFPHVVWTLWMALLWVLLGFLGCFAIKDLGSGVIFVALVVSCDVVPASLRAVYVAERLRLKMRVEKSEDKEVRTSSLKQTSIRKAWVDNESDGSEVGVIAVDSLFGSEGVGGCSMQKRRVSLDLSNLSLSGGSDGSDEGEAGGHSPLTSMTSTLTSTSTWVSSVRRVGSMSVTAASPLKARQNSARRW